MLILCSGCAVHVSKSFKHPHAPNSLFHPVSFFSSQMQSPNLFQILHCFMYYKPRQFRPSLSPFFFFLFLCTLPTSLHLECCATPFMLPFQRRNAHYHISFFNSSHNFDSLRSASMRLSDKRSLYSSIHHYTAAQPVFGTKSFHCSQISFVFLNLLIGVEQRCLARNESLFASILSRNDLHITRWTVNVFDYILLVILTSNRSFGHLR